MNTTNLNHTDLIFSVHFDKTVGIVVVGLVVVAVVVLFMLAKRRREQ